MTRFQLTKHAAVIVVLLFGPLLSPEARARPLQVDASEIYLNPEDRTQSLVGRLRYVTGLQLRSTDPEFGGLSGHTLLPDGIGWIAVSDDGRWLKGRFSFNSRGAVTGIARVEIADLTGADGKPLPRTFDKRMIDSEAVRQTADGGFLVSFEGRHRIHRYPADGGLGGVPRVMTPPKHLGEIPRNGGLEAIAPLSGDRVLAITENMRDKENRLHGWLLEGDVWRPLLLTATGLYKPTDMAPLPDGNVLLLERRFTYSGGPAARISLLRADTLRPNAILRSETLAELALPMNVDNFEGLAVRPDGAGGWDLFLLSDDNFNPIQRTLLLQFHLPKHALSK